MSRPGNRSAGRRREESFVSGAVKLTAAGLLVRVMGFANRIFMSNLVGAEGMGLYQLAFPVYSLIILTLTSGVSVSVSGLTAKYRASGRDGKAAGAARAGCAVLFLAGTACGLVMAAFARPIAVYLLGDSRTALSMAVLAPCIPIVASASAIKGYFYGMSDVTPTALSQIAEQLARIGFILAMSGVIAGQSLENACAIMTVSSAVGEMANLLVVSVAFRRASRETDRESAREARRFRERATAFRQEASGIVKDALPVSASRFLTSVMGTVETILLPARFLAGGMDSGESLSMLGRLSGMAMPLISFPSVVTSALATTLVPAIASAMSVGRTELARSRISRCIRMSLVMGFLFFALFFTFGDGIGDLLYPGEHVGRLIREMSVFCVLLYLQQTMNGILNGLDKQAVSLLGTAAGSAVRLAAIWFLVPPLGVDGYIAGMLAGTVLSCGISFVYIVRNTRLPIRPGEWFALPCLPAAALMLSGNLLLSLLPVAGNGTVRLLAAVLISMLLWLWLMQMTGQFSVAGVREMLFPKRGGGAEKGG